MPEHVLLPPALFTAMRKTKFFLHPDKLPNDLTKGQAFLFRMLWDIIQDAWEAFEEKR